MQSFSWTCPHCSRPTTITDQDVEYSSSYRALTKKGVNHTTGVNLLTSIIQCPNSECRKHTIDVIETNAEKLVEGGEWIIKDGETQRTLQFYPEKAVKNYPDYVPKAIKSDYREAVLISELSPKASATLSRRCLQGILRDYWQVKPGRLVDEIKEIVPQVDPLTWDAIDSTRKIGNIGAHMEKDIDTIVEVDPEEATLLIHLIETLIENCYVQRHERNLRLKAIKDIADSKK